MKRYRFRVSFYDHGFALGSLSDAFGRWFRFDPNQIGETGATRLQYAVLQNDINLVARLIAHGADVNMAGRLKYPPLHLALDRGCYDIALLLTQAGADLHLCDTEGHTPLHIAARQGQDIFVQHLVCLGADVNARDHRGRTPLHETPPIKIDVILALIESGANVNIKDDQGHVPLRVFLYYPQILSLLLKAGADVNARDNKEQSPFSLLLETNTAEHAQDVLRMFLRHGADLNTRNLAGDPAAHVFIRAGLWDLFLLAEQGSDPQARDARGNTILHAAIAAPKYELAQAFASRVLDKTPDLIHAVNEQGLTPFAQLVRSANRCLTNSSRERIHVLARTLIDRGADASTADENGRTLLHYAVSNGHSSLVWFLIGSKVDLDARDVNGHSALSLAIRAKDIETVDHLLDAGADPDQTDTAGWTLLDRLAQTGDRDSPIVQRLIVGGASYKKQLPLQPDSMRHRIHKPRPPGHSL